MYYFDSRVYLSSIYINPLYFLMGIHFISSD